MSKDKEANNQKEEDLTKESSDSNDLNNLTYEELLEQVEKQKEETLRAVAELENFRKRSTNEITNALKYANSELLLSIIPLITSLEKSIENSEQALTAWYNLWFSESLLAGHIQLADNDIDFIPFSRGAQIILVRDSPIELILPIDGSIRPDIGEWPIDVAIPL